MKKLASLQLTRPAALAVRRGHPWVYRDAIRLAAAAPEHGAFVAMIDDESRFLARALWDARSPIAARVFSADEREQDLASLLVSRFDRALAARDDRFADTNTYRLVNGEGDRLPGLVVDRYAHVAVVKLDTDALERHLERVLARLAASLASRGITSIARRVDGDRVDGASKLEPLHGDAPPDRIEVEERGVRMIVDLARGQKTGAFLDQRENRRRVRELAGNTLRVLNLFSYAGGFSVSAALGGAAKVTSVDVASAAHATAQQTFRANGLNPAEHAFVSADVFAFLDAARLRKDTWDLVVSDPPSFAPNERSKDRALTAYRKLHAAARAVLADHGVLCASSCSSHIPMEDFLTTLDDRAIGGGLSVRGAFGQPADHPTLPAWPEGRYLKFVVLS